MLSLIADGHPDITYVDIFAAAEEALALYESKHGCCLRNTAAPGALRWYHSLGKGEEESSEG